MFKEDKKDNTVHGRFSLLARVTPGGRSHENRLAFDRASDKVIDALKTIVAHAHIVVDDGYNTESLDSTSLKKQMRHFFSLVFPYMENTEDGEPPRYLDPKDAKSSDVLLTRHMRNAVIPSLRYSYADFPALIDALDTFRDLLPHNDVWKNIVRSNLEPLEALKIIAALHDEYKNRPVAVVKHSEHPEDQGTEAETLRIITRKDAEMKIQSDEMRFLLPTGPKL